MNIDDKPSSYYQFDDENREIHFSRYDMPTPWMNYLSNETFHVMMSHAGGGVAFYKSPQIWRINHYKFFHIPADRSGFYTYIKDQDSVWCPTSQPVSNKPEQWESTHGMGYTRFDAKKQGVRAEVEYFVGKQEDALIWDMKFTSDEDKEVTVYPFVELGMMEFLREMQWQCYNKHQLSVEYDAEDEILFYRYGVESQPKPKETPLVYFAANRKIESYEGDRDAFIGSYRSEENPLGLETVHLSNTHLKGGDPCFALQIKLSLKKGEQVNLQIYLGTGMTQEDIRHSVSRLRRPEFVKEQRRNLEQEWERFLSHFQCEMEDHDIERMVNTWNPYQAQRNFLFSRNISYYATGTFRGVGYRDTAQDVLAMVPFSLQEAKDKVRLLLSQQYQDGHVNHYFFPVEGYEPVTSVHSDDHLWSILAVDAIVKEEGDLSFLKEKVPFYDGTESDIYDHLYRAIYFTTQHMGENGFPLMLRSDWNDALFRVCKEGKGESIWTAMQFGTALLEMIEFANRLGKEKEAAWYQQLYKEQKELVDDLAWDGKWFRRAVMDSGEFLGCESSPEAKIWLNAQSWAVISGMGDEEKNRNAMDSVYEMLDTPMGIKKIEPPIVEFPSKEDPLTNYNPGTGENGSVFCHANTWAIIAECLLGNADRAYEYYNQLIPKHAMEYAGVEKYKAEPYVYASNIFGPDSMQFGLANVSWLTGTAAWMYIAVTQYMLGIRAEYDGLRISPCLSEKMGNVTVWREFRGCRYCIHIIQDELEKGLFREGQRLDGAVVRPEVHEKECEIYCYV